METSTRQISFSTVNTKRPDELKLSLGRIAYDLASMKNIKAPVEEINVLERIWCELLGEYRELMVPRIV